MIILVNGDSNEIPFNVFMENHINAMLETLFKLDELDFLSGLSMRLRNLKKIGLDDEDSQNIVIATVHEIVKKLNDLIIEDSCGDIIQVIIDKSEVDVKVAYGML